MIDIAGQRFGRLQALEPKSSGNGVYWHCRCDCGSLALIYGGVLRNGTTQSCGCLVRERVRAANTTHGMTRTKTYMVWVSMRRRCEITSHPRFADWGGRGIKVCDRWQSFENFISDMGEAPAGLQLDRIDNDGNYEPGNCRWATPRENCAHRRPARKAETRC